MNQHLKQLFEEIERARHDFLNTIQDLSPQAVNFKSSSSEWSILEIAEHMVWAEQAGIVGMFKVIEKVKEGEQSWEGENINAGLSIEEVVDRTWQPKEKVPKVAEPRWGGSIQYWTCALKQCKGLLDGLSDFLEGVDPTTTIYPHPISGPLNVIQRLEFLRFHMDRHRGQIERVKAHPDFPKGKA